MGTYLPWVMMFLASVFLGIAAGHASGKPSVAIFTGIGVAMALASIFVMQSRAELALYRFIFLLSQTLVGQAI